MNTEEKFSEIYQKINDIDYKLTEMIQKNANQFKERNFVYDDIILYDLEDFRKKELEIKFDYTNLYKYDQKDMYNKMIFFLNEIKKSSRYKKETETCFLAMNIINRYLSKMNEKISLKTLSYLIYASTLIAIKYVEQEPTYSYIDIPSRIMLTVFRGNVYGEDEFEKSIVLEAEDSILNKLKWNIKIVSPLIFLYFYSEIANFNRKENFLAMIICESSLTSFETFKFLPSLIAATAVYITRKEMNIVPNWDFQLFYYTKLTEKDLEECYNVLNKLKDEMELFINFKKLYYESKDEDFENYETVFKKLTKYMRFKFL